MSKDKIQLLSPLFLKYQEDFEKNPRSRVFAPLAETYRKLGMTDKAMEILSQGIRFHPTYILGYLGLAFCYYDLRQYNLAYSTLRPLVEGHRDNIRLQKLFADVCLEQGHKEEALDTYKYLLFINPKDKEVADKVAMLEKTIEEQYRPTHQPIFIPDSEFKSKKELTTNQVFDTEKLENRPNSTQADFDDWMTLDLSKDQSSTKTIDPYEAWNVSKGALDQDEAPIEDEELSLNSHAELKIDLDFDDDLSLDEEPSLSPTPLVTHTLVDLYIGQGHIEKALEVLDKILILNPNDLKTIEKISEIKTLMNSFSDDDQSSSETQTIENEFDIDEGLFYSEDKNQSKKISKSKLSILSETSEEDGRKQLMSIFDEQIKPLEIREDIKKEDEKEKARTIEKKLSQFLKKIQKRALDYQARL